MSDSDDDKNRDLGYASESSDSSAEASLGFLFGNIDRRGRLLKGEYEDDVREGIDSVAKGQVLEADHDTIPTSEIAATTSVVTDVNYSRVKDPTAIDYMDISELSEDEPEAVPELEERAAEYMDAAAATFGFGSTSDDDYDVDSHPGSNNKGHELARNGSASVLGLSNVVDEVLFKASRGGDEDYKAAVARVDRYSICRDIQEACVRPPKVDSNGFVDVCDLKEGIIRFSELFAPKDDLVYPKRTQFRSMTVPIGGSFIVSDDESVLLSLPLSALEKKQNENENGGFKKDKLKLAWWADCGCTIHNHYKDNSLNSNQIKYSNSSCSIISSSNLKPKMIENRKKVLNLILETFNNNITRDCPLCPAVLVEWEQSVMWGDGFNHFGSNDHVTKFNSANLHQYRNHHLDSHDWIANIEWGSNIITQDSRNITTTSLIFDLNDPYMRLNSRLGALKTHSRQKNALPPVLQLLMDPHVNSIPNIRSITTIALNPTVEDDIGDIESVDNVPSGSISSLSSPFAKFNLSNDAYYNSSQARQRLHSSAGKMRSVKHSFPAIRLGTSPAILSVDDLRNFHKPKLSFLKPGLTFNVCPFDKENTSANLFSNYSNNTITNSKNAQRDGEMRHRNDLTAADGRVVLMEYIEERPPILLNVGMATRVIHFYRKVAAEDAPLKTRHDDGEMIVLDNQDPTPFLGQMVAGQTVSALSNNMFRAPIVRSILPTTDFLVIHQRGNIMHIREIPAIFTVGGYRMLVTVPQPQARIAAKIIQSRITVFVLRWFARRRSNPGDKKSSEYLSMREVLQAFPSVPETVLRKRLKIMCDLMRGHDNKGLSYIYPSSSGSWRLKKIFLQASEDDIRKLVVPEDVCMFESLNEGLQRLKDVGIHNLTGLMSFQQILGPLERDELKAPYAYYIFDELQRTPWALTKQLQDARFSKASVPLSLYGDPTGCLDNILTRQEHSGQRKRTVDADPRRLALRYSREALLALKTSMEKIRKMVLYQRISYVRQLAFNAVQAGETSSIAARLARPIQNQTHLIKEDLNANFLQQLSYLSLEDGSKLVEEDDEDDGGLPFIDNNGLVLSQSLSPVCAIGAIRRFTLPIYKGKNDLSSSRLDDDNMNQLSKIVSFLEKEDVDINLLMKNKVKAAALTASVVNPVSIASATPCAGKRYALRQIKTTTLPNGSKHTFIDIITDPKEISKFIKQKRRESLIEAPVQGGDGYILPRRNKRLYSDNKYESQFELNKWQDWSDDENDDEGNGVDAVETDSNDDDSAVGTEGMDDGCVLSLSRPFSYATLNSKSSTNKRKRSNDDDGSDLSDDGRAEALRRQSLARRKAKAVERPDVLLLNLLNDIIAVLVKVDVDQFFRHPVNKRLYPTYFVKVSKPMDLSTMKNKINLQEYPTPEQFRADIEQIVSNSVIFNGADAAITKSAKKLLYTCDDQLKLREKDVQMFYALTKTEKI